MRRRMLLIALLLIGMSASAWAQTVLVPPASVLVRPTLLSPVLSGFVTGNYTLQTPTLNAPTFVAPTFPGGPITLQQQNGNYTVTWANPLGPRLLTIPDPGQSDSFVFSQAPQTLTNKTLVNPLLVGVTAGTNAPSGDVGEYISQIANNSTATVTFVNGSANITWTAHGLTAGTVVYFTTTVSLPTNFSASTPYFVVPTGLTANVFQVSATYNGTAILAGSAGTGTQTGFNASPQTSGSGANIAAISLSAGDWDVTGAVDFAFASSTSYTNLTGSISTTSATLGNQDSGFDFEIPASVPTAAFNMTFPMPVVRMNLTSTTTVYLVTKDTFTVSTLAAYGTIRARRMR